MNYCLICVRFDKFEAAPSHQGWCIKEAIGLGFATCPGVDVDEDEDEED